MDEVAEVDFFAACFHGYFIVAPLDSLGSYGFDSDFDSAASLLAKIKKETGTPVPSHVIDSLAQFACMAAMINLTHVRSAFDFREDGGRAEQFARFCMLHDVPISTEALYSIFSSLAKSGRSAYALELFHALK